MRYLVQQFIERPLAAFISSVEILGEGLRTEQTIDGIVSRLVHTLSSPPDRKRQGEPVEEPHSSECCSETKRDGPG